MGKRTKGKGGKRGRKMKGNNERGGKSKNGGKTEERKQKDRVVDLAT